jgi:hypothetical protein
VGVSYAAIDALPGDLLYPVKVDVNEEVKTALLTTNEDRLEWERERAELRLEEASQLASEGRLNTELTNEVSRRFAKHADSIVAQVRAVENTDPFLAAQVTDEFKTALDTHEAVLARLAVEQATPAVMEDTRNLVEQVHTVAVEAAKMRDKAEEQVATDIGTTTPSQTPEATSSVTGLARATGTEVASPNPDGVAVSANMREQVISRAETRANEQLARVEALLGQSEGSSTILIEARDEMDQGKQQLLRASDLTQTGDMSNAYRAYRAAAGVFQKIAQLLEVNRMFSIEIPTPTDVTVNEHVQNHTLETNLEQLHTETEAAITEARTTLLGAEGLDDGVVEKANANIKDAAASLLRGEIAQSLNEPESARTYYKNAQRSAELATSLVQVQTTDGSSHEKGTNGENTTSSKKDDANNTGHTPVLSVVEHYVDNVRIFTGTITGLSCATLTPMVVSYGSTTPQVGLILSSVGSIAKPCGLLGDDVRFEATSSADQGPLRAVILNGVPQQFTVLDEHSTGTATSPE